MRRRLEREGSVMKVLLGCVLMIALSGCIPIGLQGRTSAIDAPGAAAAARSSIAPAAAAVDSVSA